MLRKLLFSVNLLVTAALTAAFGWWLGFQSAYDQLETQAKAQSDLVISRLLGQLESHRELPAVLSYHPLLRAALVNPEKVDMDRVNALLQRVNDTTGALEIYLMREDGLTVAASNARDQDSFVGQNFSFRPYFQRAILGSLGIYSALGTTSGERGFFFAGPVRDANAQVIGVIAVKADTEELESGWRGDPQVVFFTDSNAVVLVSNRQPLLYRSLIEHDDSALSAIAQSRRYAGRIPRPMLGHQSQPEGDSEIWELTDPGWAQVSGKDSWVAHVSQPVLQMDLTAHVLMGLEGVRSTARLWALLAAAGTLIFGLIILIFYERRMAMLAQLATDAHNRAELESRVQERTAQLTDEIAERRAAEAALRQAQDDLVQAGKLSALGQISAGISHELNQPLAAIQSFAENAVLFLERGKPDQAQGNLSRIGDLSHRMARIIKNLRAFARKEGEPVRDIDLIEVLADTVELMQAQVKRADVEITFEPPARPAIARGGVVRLQQVLINLITNAAEAMQGSETRHITLSIHEGVETFEVRVRDTGPGLMEPDHIFEPFYTTKTVDQGDGLGLGLSISYGIVQSLGGNIRGENPEGGGALFAVELPKGGQDDH